MDHKILKMENIPKKFFNLGVRKYYKKNEFLIQAGEYLDNMYILVDGEVVQITNSKSGTMIYDFLILAPSIISVNNKYKRTIAYSSFKCIKNCEIIVINKNTVDNIIEKDNELKTYLEAIYYKFIDIFVERGGVLTAEERMTNLLIEFAEKFGETINGKIKINYILSQQFISDLLGVSRRTTCKLIKKLKDDNLIEYYEDHYYIKNIELLKQK